MRRESVTVHGSELVLHLNYITGAHISVIRDYGCVFTLRPHGVTRVALAF